MRLCHAGDAAKFAATPALMVIHALRCDIIKHTLDLFLVRRSGRGLFPDAAARSRQRDARLILLVSSDGTSPTLDSRTIS